MPLIREDTDKYNYN